MMNNKYPPNCCTSLQNRKKFQPQSRVYNRAIRFSVETPHLNSLVTLERKKNHAVKSVGFRYPHYLKDMLTLISINLNPETYSYPFPSSKVTILLG